MASDAVMVGNRNDLFMGKESVSGFEPTEME
jgi:hypothetical protein